MEPLKIGTRLLTNTNEEYIIYSEQVVYGGNSIIYNVMKKGEYIKYRLKEACNLDSSFQYIRDHSGKIIPYATSKVNYTLASQALSKAREELVEESNISQKVFSSLSYDSMFVPSHILYINSIVIEGVPHSIKDTPFLLSLDYDQYSYSLKQLIQYIELNELGTKWVNEQRKVSLHFVLSFIEQLLISLSNIHSANYLYGDIHYDNFRIFQIDLDNNYIGNIRFLDFGNSKPLYHGQTYPLSKKGRKGTYDFLPPEMLDDEVKLTPSSDLYSVGCIMLYMLMDYTQSNILKKKIDTNLDALITYSLHYELMNREDCKENALLIESIIRKALAIKPDDRYQTCQDMIYDLKQIDYKQESYKVVNEIITLLPPATNREIVEREKELQDIQTLIQLNKLIQISGMGGIGKTTLFNILFHSIKEDYEVKGYYVFQDNLRTTLLKQTNLYLNELDENRRFQKIMTYFRYDIHSKIIFIDNFDHEDPMIQDLTTCPNLKIILTSRLTSIYPFKVYALENLSSEGCIELFYQSCSYMEYKEDLEKVEKCINYVGMNTLLIILIAKCVSLSTNIHEVYHTLQENGLDFGDKVIKNEYHIGTLSKIVQTVFDLHQLSKEKRRILVNIACMPDIELPYEVVKWIKALDYDFEGLINQGLLEVHHKSIYMHPVIRQTVLLNKGYFSQNQFDSFIEYVRSKEYYNIKMPLENRSIKKMVMLSLLDYMDLFINEKRIPCISTIVYMLWDEGETRLAIELCERGIDNVKEASKTLFALLNAYGLMMIDIGNYKKADLTFDQCSRVAEELNDDHNRSICLLHKANVQGELGNDREYIRQLKILLDYGAQRNIGDQALYGAAYHGLGMSYQELKEYELARYYYSKGMEAFNQHYKQETYYTGVEYISLAKVYLLMEQYDEALSDGIKGYEIIMNHSDESTSTSISATISLGYIYMNLQQYDQAEKLFIKALQDNENNGNLNKKILVYGDLIQLYMYKYEYDKARYYVIKLQEILDTKESEKYEVLAKCYLNLVQYYYMQDDLPKCIQLCDQVIDKMRSMGEYTEEKILEFSEYRKNYQELYLRKS